jgi:acyl-CoA reductase-like NAD-dependent aldehyde dehydrogenase
MIQHRDIKKINFTGSTNVGRIIGRLAGENLKPVLLELGGKAPAIVCEDADLSLAAQQVILGAFIFAGQICMSTERVLVHKSIQSAFHDSLQGWLAKLCPETNRGLVVISRAAGTRHKDLVHDAVNKGARILGYA